MRAHLLMPDSREWRAFLSSNDHDIYHLPDYAVLSARQEGATATALHVEDGGHELLLPLLLREIPGGGCDMTSPYGYPGPLLSGGTPDSFATEALAVGSRTLLQAGVVTAFVRFHPLLSPQPPAALLDSVSSGRTVVIDLARSPETRWREMHHGHRGRIRKALQAGYSARIDQTWSRFETFKQLYRETMARVSASAFYLFDDAYFDGLRAALEDRLRLCVVEVDGCVAAAALFSESCGIVQYHLSGSDPAAAGSGASRVMIQFMAAWAEARGDRWLHLGGGLGGGTDSLFDFKAGFSPVRPAYHTLRLVIDEAAYARLVRQHDPARDPSDRAGYFPAYRTA